MEEQFKNKLEQYKVEWDKKELLPNLKKELHPPARKRRSLWYFLLPVVALSTWMLTTHYSESRDEHRDNNAQNKLESIKANNAPIDQEDGAQQAQIINASKFDQNTSDGSQKKGDQRAKIERSKSTQEPENTNENLINNQTSIQRKQQTISANQGRKQRREKTRRTNLVMPIQQTNTSLTKLESEASSAKHLGALRKKDDIESFTVLSMDMYLESSKDAKIPLVFLLDSLSQSQYQFEDQSKWYLSLSSDLGPVSRQRTFNSEDSDFIQLLKESESLEAPILAYTFGVGTGYRFHTDWSIETGFEYFEVKEIFRYVDAQQETFKMQKTDYNYYIVDRQDTTYVYDSITVNRTIQRNVRHYNSHKLYTIPLSVAYQSQWRKLRIEGRVGVSYTFAQRYSGRYLDASPLGETQVVSSGLDYDYSLINRLGLNLGVRLYYPLAKRHHFFVSAAVRRSPQMRLDIQEQTFTSYTLGLGVNYAFAKMKD